MSLLRRFLYHSAGTLHKLTLLILPVLFATAWLLSNPTYIENALKESRVYDQFVATVIDNSQKETADPDSKKILADPGVQAAAEKSFTPALLQSSAENVIDGVFAWMHGKTAEPQFRIDLTNAKVELSKNIAAYAEKRANSLPPCTIEQLRQLNPDIDLLQIPCLPPGVNVSALAQDYSQEFLTSGDFLSEPVITNETIVKDNNGKPLSEQLKEVPEAYSALNLIKWLVLVLALVLTGLLIFARRDRRAGIRHVAWTLLGVGTFLVIMLIVYWFVFDRANSERAATDAIQAMWIDGAKAIIRDFNTVILWFSAGYLLLGAGLLAFLRFRPANHQKQPSPIESSNNSESSENEPQSASTEQKSE